MSLLHLISPLIGLAERGSLPDKVVRTGIRNLLKQRLNLLQQQSPESEAAAFQQFLKQVAAGPIAMVPEKANEQHYEVPAAFFQLVLGKHRKYSCCHFSDESTTLDNAEDAALQITCGRADLANGQRILELGCGWGSLSLWMAEHFPGSQIVAVSNSNSQRKYITETAEVRGLKNLTVVTCDINDFTVDTKFDRVVSVEMFEHVRNHGALMQNINEWLHAEGKLFVHIFCHNRFTYPFEDAGATSWMARHFFSGGIMPGRDLLLHYQRHLKLETSWNWDGQHYERTSNEWLLKMDQNPAEVRTVLQQAYGKDWQMWRQRWRMFFMACAELFGFNGGSEWFVAHYLFSKPTVNGSQISRPG